MPAPSREDLYDFIKPVGRGGMAVVELWRQRFNKEELVVAKRIYLGEMSEEELKDAQREVKVMKRLQHPNIVDYLGSWVSRKSKDLIIVQSFCEGGDLACLIKSRRAGSEYFPVHQVSSWTAQLAHALQYCHRRLRILHRDLKPSNVFLSADCTQTYLGDFGIAKELGSTRMLCNTFVGTQMYMSPEVLKMQLYGLKSDVWGLGMILYEMCALQRVFQNKNTIALMQAIVAPGQPPPFPPEAGYPEELQELCYEMLLKEVDLRPTLGELLSRRPFLRCVAEELERSCNWTETLLEDTLPSVEEEEFCLGDADFLDDDPDVEDEDTSAAWPDADGTPLDIQPEGSAPEGSAPASPTAPGPLGSGVICRQSSLKVDGQTGRPAAFVTFAAESAQRLTKMPHTKSLSAGKADDPMPMKGWGQPPPPLAFSAPPRWLMAAVSQPEGPKAAADAVHEAAKVQDLVELTLRRRELEAVLAGAQVSEEEDEEEEPPPPTSSHSHPAPFFAPLPPLPPSQDWSCSSPEEPAGQLRPVDQALEQMKSDTALLAVRLHCLQLLEVAKPCPMLMTQALQQHKEMQLVEEECGQALLAHAHRLRMNAEVVVGRQNSLLEALEPAAEVLEMVGPEVGGCKEGILESAQVQMCQAREIQLQIGLRILCGPFIRLASVPAGSSLAEVRGQVAKRLGRPQEGLTFTLRDGSASMALEKEEQWMSCVRLRPFGPIELQVPTTTKAPPKPRRGKVSLAGLAASGAKPRKGLPSKG